MDAEIAVFVLEVALFFLQNRVKVSYNIRDNQKGRKVTIRKAE